MIMIKEDIKMKKRVNIYPTRPITNVTPIIRGVVKDVIKDEKTIRLCILGMAKVEEILKNGSVIILNLNNYNIDNNIEPDVIKNNTTPASEEQTNKETAPVEQPSVTPDTNTQSITPPTPVEPAKEPEITDDVTEEVVESTSEEKKNEESVEPAKESEMTDEVKEEVSDKIEEAKDKEDDVDPSEIESITKELDSIIEDDINPEDCEKGKDDEYGM